MRLSPQLRIGLIGLGVALLVVVRSLSAFGWDPSSFVRFGEDDPHLRGYAHMWLGEDVMLAPALGHDGKYFFMQAMDPFYLEPDTHAAFLDRPAYRAQRMVYPAMASLGGLLEPEAIQWGLVVVNVLALAVGTYFTSRVAQEMGGAAWLGLAFALNPGLLFEVVIDGSGVVGAAALMAGIWCLMVRRMGWAVVSLTVAALSRETMLLSVMGVIAYYVWRDRKLPDVRLAFPFVAVGGWWVYLRVRLEAGATQDLQAVDLPFAGFIGALNRWMSAPDPGVDILMGFLILALCFVVLYRTFKAPTLLGAAVAGIALLGLLMSEPVWYRYFDSSRAVAPVFTAFVLMTVTRSSKGYDEHPSRSEVRRTVKK